MIIERHGHGVDAPFPKYVVGSIVIWRGRYAFVTEIGPGNYGGERLTFKMWDDGAVITTDPDLDPTFDGVP